MKACTDRLFEPFRACLRHSICTVRGIQTRTRCRWFLPISPVATRWRKLKKCQVIWATLMQVRIQNAVPVVLAVLVPDRPHILLFMPSQWRTRPTSPISPLIICPPLLAGWTDRLNNSSFSDGSAQS